MDVTAIVTNKDNRVVAMIEKFSLEPYGWNLLALGREMVRLYPDCRVSMTTHNYKIGDKFNPKHNDGWGYLFQWKPQHLNHFQPVNIVSIDLSSRWIQFSNEIGRPSSVPIYNINDGG